MDQNSIRRALIVVTWVATLVVIVPSAYAEIADRRADAQRLAVLAQRGDTEAQYNLAEIYRVTNNLPHSLPEAAKWYGRAGAAGHSKAQFMLGIMYIGGIGVPQDYALAYMWMNLAAASAPVGDTIARLLRNEVAEKLSPAQIAESQRMARELLERSRARGKK